MSSDRKIVREIIKQSGIQPQKSLGQNFFANLSMLEKVAADFDIKKSDTVVEVGPGLGFLTQELVKYASLVEAIEIDANLVKYLQTHFANTQNLKITNQDILQYIPPDDYILVGNLPYYLSARLLRRFLGGEVFRPKRVLIMLQKEVAEKLVGEKSSILGLSVAIYGDAKIIARLSADDFIPSPQVESAIVEINVLSKPRISTPEKIFFAVVKSAFNAPRKKISNTLRALNANQDELAKIFTNAKVDPGSRPERLSWQDFDRLAQEFSKI
jgi:16S rRNA (adenine1518-N6/adenine1519-N6)-dimethyltransferase